LRDDLIIEHFRGLSLELQEPSVEIKKCFFLSLNAGQEIFFRVELPLEPLEVGQELLL
jgi:hypothetical protein